MVKRVSKIALALLISVPILAGCAKSPFTTSSDGSSPSTSGGAMGGSAAAVGVRYRGGAGGAYGQGGAAARPNPKDFTTAAQLKDIRFDFDRYDIRAEDAEVLDANAESMKSNPKMQCSSKDTPTSAGPPSTTWRWPTGARRRR